MGCFLLKAGRHPWPVSPDRTAGPAAVFWPSACWSSFQFKSGCAPHSAYRSLLEQAHRTEKCPCLRPEFPTCESCVLICNHSLCNSKALAVSELIAHGRNDGFQISAGDETDKDSRGYDLVRIRMFIAPMGESAEVFAALDFKSHLSLTKASLSITVVSWPPLLERNAGGCIATYRVQSLSHARSIKQKFLAKDRIL